MFNLNDSDDDIFDDTTTLSDSSAPFVSETIHSHKNNKEDISEIFENLTSRASGATTVSKMFITFYESCTSWLEHEYQTCFNKAIFTFNEHLIQGNVKPFPYYEKFYTSQDRISKRRIVNLFLKEIISNPENIQSAANKIGLGIDAAAINTYFSSFYNINNYAILEDFAHCKALSEYLSIEFNENVMKEISEEAVVGTQPYSMFIQTQFGLAVNEEFADILAKSMKESIDRFVKIETAQNSQED
jgi:hypothetical protein